MLSRRKSPLETNDDLTEADGMVLVSLLIAPAVMAAAALAERRLGPSAAGWVAALPASFAVALVAVAIDSGDGPAATMALSAAAHVPAQVAFALAFAAALMRRGLLAGLVSGALAYLTCSLLLADVPEALAVALALPALAFGPRLIASDRPPAISERTWGSVAMTCLVAAVVVATALVTIRFAGPVAAGATAAFPTMSATLAIAVARRHGRAAGAHALAGLVRSLPCYLSFCLVVALAAPVAGLPAVALALLACLAAGRITWRAVPLAPRVAAAH
jgi:hypothetical protein